ncbi:stAR-related lipid transfer protein 9 isoform X2 [Sceloporus undulatus]|uniref:stAR-related lipid transfer protein 9 isoform X2 n=1 Tax=Sceloporus undulatus TaxID=8520 RepID=UPI001C4ACEE6|nr:stAR-related lipid transfer protein 9 isoform X2 [Sceloporus undulatus]
MGLRITICSSCKLVGRSRRKVFPPPPEPLRKGLSQHVVTDYKQVVGLLEEGIANRITAATHVHDASSRSHAIFTIQYTQAILYNNLPSEITSKINLVDLAGSERADYSYCKDRITEGANINKSLVTLGIVISSLAQNSQMFSSCQSINSIASEVDSSHTDNPCGASISSHRRQAYIPYRDSILTWLLKDSLGGNSKTIMIATISPASSCYNETMSTLRYASNAKNIINKPRVNEDANVKLIRELREEIDRLKAMLMNFELRNASPSWSDDKEGNLTELVLQNEIKIEKLTKDWTDKWINKKAIMEEYNVDINKKKAGVVIDSSLPHLMAMDDDILSTGVVLYHLREGTTKIGRSDSKQEQDIVLQGQWIKKDHCIVDNQHGIVTLQPLHGAHCIVNGHEVADSVRLSQGAVIILGKAHKFRFNHPAEAAILRQRRSISDPSSVVSCRSLDWLDLDGNFPSLSYSFSPPETKSEQREAVHKECQPKQKSQEILQRNEIQQQQLYVEELQQQILDGEIKAEQELEHEQAVINQQIKENQQWLIDETKRLAAQQQQESAVQTDAKSYAEAGIQNILESEIGPSVTEQNKKKLVQLELLRKYSLKKAERHLSRKKVKLHLERIVKKQKLLEAKKNLEQLEATCWISEDNVKHSKSLNQVTRATSWDYKYSNPESNSNSLKCRCSAVLNPQLPHYSFSLKRDPSQLSTSTPSYGCPKANSLRKSLSIENLPRTLNDPSRRDSIHDERDGSCTAQGQIIKNQKSLYFRNKGIVEHNSTNREIISLICQDNQTMEKSNNKPRQTRTKSHIPKSTSPDYFKRKCDPETVKQGAKAKAPGDSNHHSEKNLGKSESLEGSRNVRRDKRKKHQSSLPGNSIQDFKKSTVSGKPPLQQLSQTAKNVKRNTKDSSSVDEPKILKVATSARSLTNINTPIPLCHSEKRWHSAELLNVGISKGVHGPLRSWQEDEDLEFSDTDSNYSVDSLSCANAKVLTEPLTHEEESTEIDTVNLEDSESDDSQMSQDSLTGKINKSESQGVMHVPEVHREDTKFCKDNNYQPLSLTANISVSGSNLTMNERSFSLDSLGDADELSGEESKVESCDEVPAELFWKMQNLSSEAIKSDKQHNPETCSETIISDYLNLNTSSSFYLDASGQHSSSSPCDQSVKEMKISFSGQAGLLDQISHSIGENLPVLPDAWLSYDLKNGKSSPIIAMPSSQDHTEFRVAQLHPVNKSWMKKDDLRQSAAELSFISCYKKPYWVSQEPNSIEMLLSSATPSVPLPETRKYLEIDALGATSSLSLSTFPTKHSYCAPSSFKSVCQQLDFSEPGSTGEWKQTPSYLKEASGTDGSSQISDKQSLSDSSVYPEISKDQGFKNNSLISVPSTLSSQKGEMYLNTNFEECLFRTIEKGDDYDSDSSARDSKVLELNHVEKLVNSLPDESPDLTSVCSTNGSYKDPEYLFSNDKTLFNDESFYLCDKLSKHTNDGGKCLADQMYLLRCGENNTEVVQKRCQQLSAEKVVTENQLYQSKTTAFNHNDQFALPVETSETEKVSMQENRDVLTESALEVPSFREVEEEKGQYEQWSLKNDAEFQTKVLLSNSHAVLKTGYSGNSFSEGKEDSGLHMLFNENDCSRNDRVVSTMASQEQNLHMNKESEYDKDRVVTKAFTACEENKGEHNCKTINSEELTKLINSVNKLECDILEMKYNQNKCLQNFLRIDSQSRTVENMAVSESCNLVQRLGSDHENGCKKLLSVTNEEIDKGGIQLINVNKEKPCVSKIAVEKDTSIQTTGVSCNEIQGNSTESSCLADIKQDPENTVQGVLLNSTVLTHSVLDLGDSCDESTEVDQTIENILFYEPRASTIIIEHREENTLNSSEEGKKEITNNEISLIESLIMYPKTAQEKEVDVGKVCSQRSDEGGNDAVENKEFVNSKLTELYTDENVVLFQENPVHAFMNSDNDLNRTNQGDTENPETDFSVPKLEEKESVYQLAEAARISADETYDDERSTSLCSYMGVMKETLKDNCKDGGSDDCRAITNQCIISEEFSTVGNINAYKSSCTNYLPNIMPEHSNVNFADLDIYKCLPSNSLPKEKETTHPITPVKLTTAELLGQGINAQSSYTFKTVKEREELEENNENSEADILQTEVLSENKYSNLFSNSRTMLSEVLEEKEWVPHTFSRNKANVIDDSIPSGHTNLPQSTNQDCDLSSVVVKSFPHQLAYSHSFPTIITNEGNMKRSPSVPSSPAVPSSNDTSSEVLLQYYETQVDSTLEAGILSIGEINNSPSDTVKQNKCFTFLPDKMQQDGKVKEDSVSNKLASFTALEQTPVKDYACSKSSTTECLESLVSDFVQNKAIIPKKLISPGSTSCDMGRSHSEYNKGEDSWSEQGLNSLNILQNESTRSDSDVPPLILSENKEELIVSLPVLSSQDDFKNVTSQKELHLLQQYDQIQQHLDNCIKTECQTNSERFTGELGSQEETTETLASKSSQDLCVGHSNDIGATSEEGVNLSGHSDQALWGNAHYGEDSASGCNINSYISEYSASHWNSSTTLPNFLLECHIDKYKANDLYFEESKYLDSIFFDVPILTGTVQQDRKITSHCDCTKNIQGMIEVNQNKKQGQDYFPKCLHKLENHVSSQLENYMDRTKIGFVEGNLLTQQSSKQTNSEEIILSSSCSVGDPSTSVVLKNAGTPESSTSPECLTSSIRRLCVDSQEDAFLAPCSSAAFRVPENQMFCHQAFQDISFLSSETCLTYDMSHSETERHTSLCATTASCPSLATSQMQESQCDNSEMLDQQLCASETTSLSLVKENTCMPLTDNKSSSQRNTSSDCSGCSKFKSEQIFQESGVCRRNTAPLQKSFSEDFVKTSYHTLNSNHDIKGDQNTSQVDNQSGIVNIPTKDTDNNYINACEVMKRKTDQPNSTVINDSMSSKYLSGSTYLTMQEEPAAEMLGKENTVFTSESAKRSKEDGQRPGLQSHSLSAPTIVVMFNSEFASETSEADFSERSASKSLQELNMSVEPSSPTEDNLYKIESESKLKADGVLPNKCKPRFQKKSTQAHHSSHCDGRNGRERILRSHSSDLSPVHCPIAVVHSTNNSVDRETRKCSHNVNSAHEYNLGESERLRPQMDTTDKLLQDNKDVMHFSSSDINPYIHPWQQDEHCKIGWKQYVFGSASDVSSNPPPLNLDNQMVMRCSSVDNGLNSQNSPFHSHLSSYANARMLSSTISSTEDVQGWDVAREGFKITHSDESGKHYTNVSHDELETTQEKNISYCENVLSDVRCSQQSGGTPLQVDEIVLLYPSESDISPSKSNVVLTCEQETQTEAPPRHKRQKRHRRSYTDISARKTEPGKGSVQQPSSWSSVQNLSMHLSQLLHNTSELLGNLSLQTVKDSEQNGHKATEETIRAAMSNSCTQTTEDIGIQTNILGHSQSEIKERHIRTNVGNELMKSQEVNVIVKLVHSDTAALTKERMSESKGEIPHPTDAQENFCISQSTLKQSSSSLSEVPKMSLNVPPALALGKPKVSPITLSSFGSKHESTVANCPASTFSQFPAYYSQDKQLAAKTSSADTKEFYSKKSLLVDRASSPILTLSASTINHQTLSDKSTCSFKGSVGQQVDTANSHTSFIKNGAGPQYSLNSWESLVDTSSQTEVESESTASRESNEMCKITRKVLDKNTAKELDSRSLDDSEQMHRFTINTHTAVHTKRLYHSSSTLELSSHGDFLVDDHRETIPVEHSFCQMIDTRRARNFSDGINYDSPARNSEYSPSKKSIQKSLNEKHTPSFLKGEWATDCVLDSPQFNQRNEKCCPFSKSEMNDMQDNNDADDDIDNRSDTESECNTEILLSENTSLVKTQRLRSYSLRDLPLHNKFSNWCGVKGGPHSSLTSLTRSVNDLHSQAERKTMNTRSTEIEERSLLSERRAREIERLRKERAQIMSGIHLDMNQQPLTVELTEAKLTYGIGETDAQLRILQSGVGEDLTSIPIKQQLYERHRKSIQTLRKQREERLQCFRRSRSLSPQKHHSLLQIQDTNQREIDLPSRRREYLQQLRRDVVENTRVQEPKMRIQHPSEIELLLRDYQRAREETKSEIARARDKLRERAEQEKRRIREQLHSQLHKGEAKLKTLASTSTLCTDSTLSLSSGPTSGYNSSNAATSATSTISKHEDQTSSEDIEQSREGPRGRSAVRNHQLYVLEQWKKRSSCEIFPMTSSTMERSNILSSLASNHMYSHRLNVSPSTFPASPMKGFEDMSKHVLANATAEVMAVCSNDLKNLYNGQATAGWKYQCVEKDVLVYYKGFSSCATKHGFLGAGVIKRPLSTVLCMLKDASKRHLYDKTITTAQVHKKITSNIELVYVVSDVSLCYQKQPRDFCCISVEAREENVCILAIQSVYEESMPRPCKDMVRGEILPSAWILEPDTVNGKDITKVIYMVQVDLGAPAIPASLLSSVAKRQPLVIARLAHFLAS